MDNYELSTIVENYFQQILHEELLLRAMRLQSLEIKGFKSFAKDTVIHFNESVTGIVGPNGSGKSNIIDAIRWVLGEQKSKELRLEKMQDVIFNGTKKLRKSPTAEVSISFENNKGILPSDYHIVRVSRTLYRSGESEYRLNDVICRLKDIKNLLVDTGIGSNSYAIIELGMVDDILQDKDHARRKMFEQAAGISKYKSRKREALSKLSLTQTDLDRVEDLLHEITANLKSLEKQAKRAKKYLDLKAKYKEISLLFHAVKINALRDDFMKIEKEITEFNVKYIELRAIIDKKEAALEKEKLKNINDEKQLSLFQQKISGLTDTIRKQESRKEILQNEMSHSSEKVQGLEYRASKLGEKIIELSESINHTNDRIAIEEVEQNDLDAVYLQTKNKHKTLSEKYEDNKSLAEQKEQEKVELDKQQLHVEKEYAITTNKIQQAEHTINFMINRAGEQKEKVKKEKDLLQTLETELNTIQLELSDLQKSEEEKKSNLDKIREEIDLETKNKRDFQRKVDIKQNEIDLLQSMINKLEGFPESIKYLHKEWKSKKVILSDIISCKEQDRASVEMAMGEYLDYFVVETLDDAIEAISLLRKANRGKAKFFILDRIPAFETKVQTDLSSMFSLIQVEQKYEPLIQFILFDTYRIEESKRQDLDTYSNLSLVASDGSFFTKNGQIIGGSNSVFEGKRIGRKKKLEKLVKDLEILTADLQKISSKIDTLERKKENLSKQDFRQKIQQLQRSVDQKRKEQYKLQASLDNVNQVLEQHEESVKEQKTSVVENKSKLAILEKLKTEITSKIKVLVPQLSQTGLLNQLTEELSVLSREMNDAQIAMLKQQNLILNLQKENSFNTEKRNESKAEEDALLNAKKREIEKQSKRENEFRSLKILLEKSYSERKTEQSDLGGIEQSYFDAKHRITEEENQLRQLNKEFTELQSKINSYKDKASDYKFKIQGIKQRIKIEFSAEINSVEIELPEDYSLSEQELQIEKMQNRLSNFGEINPMAVEAYDEMLVRKENIETQRDDILNAKDQLIATMDEIESTATKLFLEAFEEARKHFVTVFRSLFTKDDDCDLILLDPENPLKSGIEIIAKPKGKRPQSLSQLSGGEKTLTASALLFSLYLLKPAPFCIFDEVDAPLDDQNVQKFTNIIRAFSQDSQFLVVTHNKATMAELDVLYGVFMEEKGVSSVSQVDFRNYNHDPIMAEAIA